MFLKKDEEIILEKEAEVSKEVLDEETVAQEEASEAPADEECDCCEEENDAVLAKPMKKIELSKKQKAIGIGAAAGAAALTAAAVAVKIIKGKK